MIARRIFSRVWLGLVCLAAPVVAQNPAAPPAADSAQTEANPPTTTLHVYTNLAQIPTLILSTSRERARKFDTSKLRISLDSGPLFQPTHVRVEGDDPISLAILIDMTRPDSQLLPAVEDAIDRLALGYLQPQDRISIYAMGCSLVRSAYNFPADSARLEHVVDKALSPVLNRAAGSPCPTTLPLWDSLQQVAIELSKLPGRRVVVALTSGQDTGSAANWNDVGHFMTLTSIAVFGVLPMSGMAGTAPILPPTFRFPTEERKNENPFAAICELSGGTETAAGPKTLAAELGHVAEMVRERYIIEFPRGNDFTPGRHVIAVTLPDSDDYIRPSGISIPLADRKALADPNTLPSGAATPEMGRRKILPPPPHF